MERPDSIGLNGQLASGEFGGRRAGETRDQHRVRTEAIHGTPDLARQVGCLARSWRAEDPVLRSDGMIALPDFVQGPAGLLILIRHRSLPLVGFPAPAQ